MFVEYFLTIFIPLGIAFFIALAIYRFSKNYTRLLSLCCAVVFFVIAPISIFGKVTSKGGFLDLSDIYLYFGGAIAIAIFVFAHFMFWIRYLVQNPTHNNVKH